MPTSTIAPINTCKSITAAHLYDLWLCVVQLVFHNVATLLICLHHRCHRQISVGPILRSFQRCCRRLRVDPTRCVVFFDWLLGWVPVQLPCGNYRRRCRQCRKLFPATANQQAAEIFMWELLTSLELMWQCFPTTAAPEITQNLSGNYQNCLKKQCQTPTQKLH